MASLVCFALVEIGYMLPLSTPLKMTAFDTRTVHEQHRRLCSRPPEHLQDLPMRPSQGHCHIYHMSNSAKSSDVTSMSIEYFKGTSGVNEGVSEIGAGSRSEWLTRDTAEDPGLDIMRLPMPP